MSIARYAVALLSSVSAMSLAHAALAADAPPPPTDSATEVQGVIVTAPRTEVKARKVQEDAINVINVQSAETIQKYPDFNAAEALSRMPGVSLSTDTGEGRFVNIRGIDGNLDGATFAGVTLLNTFPGGTEFGAGGRAVEFDTIPTGSIDGIILTKTTLPDHEAEGLGGTIELTPRSAAHVEQPFFDGTLGYGDEPEHNHGGPFTIDAAVGARFGFANGHLIVQGRDDTSAAGLGWISNPTPFSFVLTASRKDDFRGFDDIEESNDAGSIAGYDDVELRRYDYHRRRFGFGGDFEFNPNDDHSYYIRANIAGYTESVTKNRLTYNFDTLTPDGKGFDATADLGIASTDEQETHRNSVFIAGGQDKFGAMVLDYRVSYSRATYEQAFNYGSKWDGPTVALFYDHSDDNGDFPTIKVTDGTNINDPSLYTLHKKLISNSAEADVDDEWAYAANLTIPVHFFGDNDAFKIGGEARLRDKTSSPYIYTGVSNDPGSGDITVGPLNLSSASVPAITNFYGGRYSNGPGVNTDDIRTLFASTPTIRTLDPTAFFAAKENIYAEYAQFTTQVGAWRFLAGVRAETTDATYSAFSDDNPAETFAIVDRSEKYTNLFPTLQARYNFTPDFLVRATWSTGIGRPGFLQNTAATESNHDSTDPQITQGNPNLKPTTGNNFDLSFEYYLNDGGILQFGLFDKEFRNYIVTDVTRKIDTTPGAEFFGDPVTFTTFSNVASAYARGAELAYHQQFKWLPGLWNGFGVDANLTLVDSRIEEYSAATAAAAGAPAVAEFGLLPGTSKVTWNVAGFYEAHGFEARLAAQYVGRELFGLGGDKALDTIEDHRTTLDFTASYAIGDHWKVYFAAKNLTDAPLRFYVDQPSLPIQREFYLTTYEFGIKAKF
ncbi:MAG TPA: TonB-dependent receptor [Caulobacteraceae bacterium]|jgi:TonB-dependent receptor